MRRDELAHILRAAARITDDPEILVIGSQAILGSFSEDDLPEDAYMSTEADLAFLDGDETKPDKIDGAIGEYSKFHESFGVYGQGVDSSTAVLPAGWRQRLVPFDREDAEPSRAQCLEVHDLVVSKLVAGREKDLSFSWAVLEAGLISADVLVERTQMLEVPGAVRGRVLGWITGARQRLTDQ